MALLAVAGLSARLMAEAAARDGFEVIALDLFGDVDTCAVASRWFGIGDAAALRIDAGRTLAALAALARRGDVAGWVPGGGFEGLPGLLARGAALLPLLGTAPADVARVRDPAQFFGCLEKHDIEHPAWCAALGDIGKAGVAGWLVKNARGCGGWHVRPAAAGEPLPPHHYLQREVAGQPMSATFVANGKEAVVLGHNIQMVSQQAGRPFTHGGVVGPVELPGAVVRRVQAILALLVPAFGLKGLASLDFMLSGTQVSVLEVNPRPPASIGLYGSHGPMAAHLLACTSGALPSSLPAAGPAAVASPAVQGSEIVFARAPLRLDTALAHWLAGWPDVHDLPCAGQHFAAGDPLCSVAAHGASAAEVLARLQDSRTALLQSLESP